VPRYCRKTTAWDGCRGGKLARSVSWYEDATKGEDVAAGDRVPRRELVQETCNEYCAAAVPGLVGEHSFASISERSSLDRN